MAMMRILSNPEWFKQPHSKIFHLATYLLEEDGYLTGMVSRCGKSYNKEEIIATHVHATMDQFQHIARPCKKCFPQQ